MVINFNPQYTSDVYVASEDCGLGVSFMGPFPLLCELELRSGNSRGVDDGTRRAILYMQAMGEAYDRNPGIFFAKSFRRDDLGTAEVVLRWRDSIRRYGWDASIETTSEKLRGLAEVERFFDMEGPADRWRAILAVAKRNAILSPADVINVTCAKENLEPLYAELLDAVESYGTPVAYERNAEPELKPELISFRNDIEAHEWLSRQDYGENDVLVSASRGMLSDMLYALGKPLIGNSEDGIGPVMRLFTLGLGLFSSPVNVIDLLAYLQLPKNPLASIYIKKTRKDGTECRMSLCRVLADSLSRSGGIGKQWNEAIKEARYDCDGNELDEEKRVKILSFISMWDCVDSATKEVSRDEVLDFTKGLGRWAQRHFKKAGGPEDELDVQYHALASFCDSMKLLLEGQDARIDSRKISLWAGRIIRPVTLFRDFARKGSINVVSHLGNIHSTPEHITWFCAETRTDSGYEYSFLSKMDVNDLQRNGIEIPSRERMLKAGRNIMMNALALSRHPVTIVTCERVGAEQTSPNLVIAELTQKFGLKAETEPFIAPLPESRPVCTDSGKRSELSVAPFDLRTLERTESATSIETLINHPFEYHIGNIAELEGYGTAQMGDIYIIKGNVAHEYIDRLGKSQGYDLAKMKAGHRAEFDSSVDDIVQEKGLVLLSEENSIIYRNFKTTLRKSIDTLLRIISDMELTIVEQEYKFTVPMEPFGFLTGKVDCLLKDLRGDYVIFDFKWNESRKYFDKVQENRALQLALYKKAIETDKGAGVSLCGYYIFPKAALYTADIPVVRPQGFEPVEKIRHEDTFTQVCNSYKYRRQQLSEGILEEADGAALADLQYFSDMVSCNLYHLDSYDKITKDYAYGNSNMILKGDLI